MNLQCEVARASGYRSASQIARILSEHWCARELYCPACDSDRLTGSEPNNPAIDFECAKCEQPFQLKSLSHWNPRKVVDAGHEAMLRDPRGQNAEPACSAVLADLGGSESAARPANVLQTWQVGASPRSTGPCGADTLVREIITSNLGGQSLPCAKSKGVSGPLSPAKT
jgi:hypothetical protein